MDLFDDDNEPLPDWEALRDTLTHEPWVALTAARPGRPDVTVVTHHGRVAIHENDLDPAERAELCRRGFAPMKTSRGRCWCWAPPSPPAYAWACARQRDRTVLRVLRDVLHACPEAVVLHLEPEEEDLAV